MSQLCKRCYRVVGRACQSDTESLGCVSLARTQADEAHERERALRFMRECDFWPRWPLLPMKRAAGDIPRWPGDSGFLIADGSPTVYRGNIFALKATAATPVTVCDLMLTCSREEYESLERLYDSGWRVD